MADHSHVESADLDDKDLSNCVPMIQYMQP
jgi:hypothetical protein